MVQKQETDKEITIKGMDCKLSVDIEKIKDEGRARKDKIEEKKAELAHKEKLAAMKMMAQMLQRVNNLDQNCVMASSLLIRSMTTGSDYDKHEFGRLSSRVPEALPSNVEETIEQVIGSYQRREEREEREETESCVSMD